MTSCGGSKTYGSTSACVAITAVLVLEPELLLELDEKLLEIEDDAVDDPDELSSFVLLCELLSFDWLELLSSFSGSGSGFDGSTGFGLPSGSTVKGQSTPGILSSMPPGGLIPGGWIIQDNPPPPPFPPPHFAQKMIGSTV